MDSFQFLRVDVAVQVNEAQVGLGGAVHRLAVLLEVLRGAISNNLVGAGHQPVQVLLDLALCLHLKSVQELGCHVQKGLLGPGEEPIDGAVGHQPWEFPCAGPEFVPDGAEAKDKVKLVADAVDEVLPQVVRSVVELARLVFLRNRTDVVAGTVLVLGAEEPRNLPRREKVVDILQEPLLLDLVVCEHKRDVPLNSLEVLRTKVVEEVVHVVALCNGDLEELLGLDEGAEAGQGLLARAAHPDEHDAAPGHGEDARDTHNVLERHVEQHEVHLADLVRVVELLLCVEQPLPQGLQGLSRLVDDWGGLDLLPCVRVQHRLPQEVDPVRRGLHITCQFLAEELNHRLLYGLVVPHLVLHHVQLVAEDTCALVLPELSEDPGVVHHVPVGHHDTLRDAREVPHVEVVVKLGRRW
mmetsp:Transcript_3401/g.5806  ORF Transcript_3401/g.5806 Transcript_3401/m.5806 type:complete len:411 (+) Transcript_3401:4469-5701(+)